MFSYQFMIIALIVGSLLSIIIPIIGTHVVFKRLSMTGDALSHTSLAGVAIGLLFGYNPIVIAMITSVVAALIIEFMRKKFYKYSELAIAIVLSFGVGVAGILSSFTPMSNFSSYLFGSIVAISNIEIYLSIWLFVLVVATFILLYKELLYISYNEESAKVAKIPVTSINIIFTVITALTVALSSHIIGALVVSSLMVIPVATSMQISKSYKQTIIISIILSFMAVISGLTTSFYLGLRPGGSIVIISIIFLIIALLVKYTSSLNKTK